MPCYAMLHVNQPWVSNDGFVVNNVDCFLFTRRDHPPYVPTDFSDAGRAPAPRDARAHQDARPRGATLRLEPDDMRYAVLTALGGR